MTEPRLQVSVRQQDGQVRLAVQGEIDAHTATTLDGAVDDALGLEGDEVVLDLEGVPFMDSMGLRVLVRAQRAISERGGLLRIANVKPAVARALDYAGLTEHLTVEEAS